MNVAIRSVAPALIVACGTVTSNTPDGAETPTDAAPPTDAPAPAASCLALHARDPGLQGIVPAEIDPAGTGSSISVLCDMATEGGGWTVVFLATTADYSTANLPVYATKARSETQHAALMAGATVVLVGVRDVQGALIAEGAATFELVAALRTTPVFELGGGSMMVKVTPLGGAPAMQTLTAGAPNWDTTAADPCVEGPNVAGSRGRFCFSDPQLIRYEDWAHPSNPDACEKLAGGTLCGANRRFSLAVR